PPQPTHTALALFCGQVQDRLSIGSCAVAVPPCLESRSECVVIVNFPVKNDPDALILVWHRLMTARDIYDRQAAGPQPNSAVHNDTSSSGPRCRSTTHMRRRRASSTGLADSSIRTPQIPHMATSPL